MGVLPRSERSISQHVGLSSHHYQQLLLLYKIGSSIDRGQAKFAPVALGHARHGYIYTHAARAGLPAVALAWVAAGVAQACGVLRVALRCANVPRCVQLQRLASALSFGAGPVGIRRQLAGTVCLYLKAL